MTAKLIALAALVTVLRFSNVFFQHVTDGPQAESLAAHLLPPAIGSFRSTRRWRETLNFRRLDVGASYREAGGVEADLEVFLGQMPPHNAIDCWYIRGYPIYWQPLQPATIANRRVLFDMALFRDDHGLALLGTTQCYPSGCRASLSQLPLPGESGLRILLFSKPAVASTPISIVVRELNDPAGSPEPQGVRLVQDLDRFAARLDLSPLLVARR